MLGVAVQKVMGGTWKRISDGFIYCSNLASIVGYTVFIQKCLKGIIGDDILLCKQKANV